MANHIWVVERSINKGNFIPVDWEFTEEEALDLAKSWRRDDAEYRVRKYIPEPDNG